MKPVILIALLAISIYSCAPQPLAGLWQVDSVSMGEQEMTPIARWVHLKPDGSQVSGNGWLQHSYGKWRFNKDSKALQIDNANGYKDPAPPFTVHFKESKMYWERIEDGQEVNVQLSRISELPASPANELLGIWLLEKASSDNNDLTKQYSPENLRYLHIRWDQVFTENNTPERRQRGIWKMHGHRPLLEMVYDGEAAKRQFWTVSFDGEELILNSQEEAELELIYRRIDYFPE
jgi:hypothetical protein